MFLKGFGYIENVVTSSFLSKLKVIEGQSVEYVAVASLFHVL